MYQTRNVNICQKTFLEYFQFNLSLSWKKKKNIEFYQSMERLRKIKKKKKIVVLYSPWIVYRS